MQEDSIIQKNLFATDNENNEQKEKRKIKEANNRAFTKKKLTACIIQS